jgi:hypothetical protein
MSPISPSAPIDPVENFAPMAVGPDDTPQEDSHPLLSFRKIRSHARARRVPRWAVFVVVLGLAAVGVGLRYVPGSPFAAQTGSAAALAAPMPFHSAEVSAESLGTSGFLSWAYLDRRDGTIVGSANMTATSDSAAMIKAWIAADYLRRAAERGETPPAADLTDLKAMIRDSSDAAADRIIGLVGGPAESIGRLITMCQLNESKPGAGWGATIISARDAVRMGGCLADGRAAGAQWTPWVLDTMRSVRGEGDFGIRKVFPEELQATIAIKNGWAVRAEDGAVHANCLAIGDNWVLAVLQRYPATGDPGSDMAHVDGVCQNVARTLSAPT